MESTAWVHDDPAIPDDTVVFRRVAKFGDPNNFSIDRIHETACLGPAAFSLSSGDKGPDGGLSVHLQYLMQRYGIPTTDLADWDEFGVAVFRVKDVRDGGGGVIEKEDPDDEILGKAHALLRSDSPGMKSKRAWSSARRHALERAIYYESDPGYLG